MIRVTGEWVRMDFEKLKPDDVLCILSEIHPGAQANPEQFKEGLLSALSDDFRTETNLARFRGSAGFEQQHPYVILRPIGQDVPTLDELALRTPEHALTLRRIAGLGRGLCKRD